MLMNLWIKDNYDGSIHQIGTDSHDSLDFLNGKVVYVNLQNGTGTLSGDYEFVDAPELDDYISVTPDELRLNKALIHDDLLKISKAERGRCPKCHYYVSKSDRNCCVCGTYLE